MFAPALALLLMDPPRTGAGALEFDWYASDECPHEIEIRRQVEDLVRRSAYGEVVRASGHLVRRHASYELVLELSGGVTPARHELRGYDCDELGWLAAQIIASAIDPFVFGINSVEVEPSFEPRPAHQPPPIQRPSVQSGPPIQHPSRQVLAISTIHDAEHGRVVFEESHDVPTAPDVDLRPRSSRAVSGVVMLDGSANLSLFPGVGAGPRLTVGLDVAEFRAVLGGGGWFGPGFRETIGEGSNQVNGGGQLRGWATELGVCGLPGWQRLEFPICARAGAGQFIGVGDDVPNQRTEAQPWVWLGADFGLEWWVRPHFGLFAGIGGAGSLLRPVFHIINTSARFETPPGFVRACVGLVGRFGRPKFERASEHKRHRRTWGFNSERPKHSRSS